MLDQQWLITAAGVRMPRIIYGTAWKKARTADLVVKAVRAGFRGIDTACQPKHYHEAQVGTAINTLKTHGIDRESLYLQTKFTPLDGQDPGQVPYDATAPLPLQVAQSFEVSKKNLQTDYIDTLLLHSPLVPHSRLMTAWRAMEGIQKHGGARQLGISNVYAGEVIEALYADADVKPAVVQNRFYQPTGYDADLRGWCASHGVIYQSFWTLTANAHLLSSTPVRALAERYGRTEAQIFLRYVSQREIVPLTGTCSEPHMRDDLGIFAFELSAADLLTMDRLLDRR